MFSEWTPEPTPLDNCITDAAEAFSPKEITKARLELATLREKAEKWDHVTRWPKGVDIPCPPDGFDSWNEWMVAHWQEMKGGRTWEDFNLERDCGKELIAWRRDEADAKKWRARQRRKSAISKRAHDNHMKGTDDANER